VDVVKGLLAPTLLADGFGLNHTFERVLLGLTAVLGHSFSVFLKLKGGKGVATSLGVLMGLAIEIPMIRPVLTIALLIWLGVFLIFGFVSLASVVSVTAVPFVMVIFNQPFEIISLGIILCIFVVVRHKSNIHRILNGKESRVPFFRRKG
jgi:glycerol-3-phosphate acyltransferase PlsY